MTRQVTLTCHEVGQENCDDPTSRVDLSRDGSGGGYDAGYKAGTVHGTGAVASGYDVGTIRSGTRLGVSAFSSSHVLGGVPTFCVLPFSWHLLFFFFSFVSSSSLCRALILIRDCCVRCPGQGRAHSAFGSKSQSFNSGSW